MVKAYAAQTETQAVTRLVDGALSLTAADMGTIGKAPDGTDLRGYTKFAFRFVGTDSAGEWAFHMEVDRWDAWRIYATLSALLATRE